MILNRKACSLTAALKMRFCLAIMLALCISTHASAAVRVLVDQVGYEPQAQKQALIIAANGDPAPLKFFLVDADTGKTVLDGPVKSSGEVHAWTGMVFWKADFSSWQKAGHYTLRVTSAGGEAVSCPFAIETDVLERETLSNVIYYFKGQRATGDFDRADRRLAIPDQPGAFVDAHGGWYDATGDYGVHLSHQNLTSYFNPQQVPLVAWSLLRSYRALDARGDDNFSEYKRRMLDEGLYGADYLVRIKRAGGSFFESISAPGKQKLAKDRVIGNPNWRTQIKTSTSDSTERINNEVKPLPRRRGHRDRGSGSCLHDAREWRLHASAISPRGRSGLSIPKPTQSRIAQRRRGKHPGRLLRADGGYGTLSSDASTRISDGGASSRREPHREAHNARNMAKLLESGRRNTAVL